MGRKTKIRVNYVQDATYLNRLIDAIENDPKMSSERKRAIIEYLGAVVVQFAAHDVEMRSKRNVFTKTSEKGKAS